MEALRQVPEFMPSKLRPAFRVLSLLWNRIGYARFYILSAAALLLVLAGLGVVHLVSSATAPKSKESDPPARLSAPKDTFIAITEIGSSETRGRNGHKNVAIKIGVVPRPKTKKGEVEIRVLFFDVTPNGEMRPTDAEVDYEWLTPVRDWADPTPKYLVATYRGGGGSRKSAERLRYGGFVVRVYFDGQLQAERSEPKGLVAALRSGATPSVALAASNRRQAEIAAAPSQPNTPQPQAVESGPPENSAGIAPRASSPPPLDTNRASSSAVPYASPVSDKPGFVTSPYNPKFLVDVRGFPPGTVVIDPNTSKPFKVP